VEGVKFMYECVMGLKNKGYQVSANKPRSSISPHPPHQSGT